jgi:hypothetical protein
MEREYTIAIDFDATLTINHGFPNIGEPRMWLIEKAIEWRRSGHKLILWTCREDVAPEETCSWKPRKYLTEAVNWCRELGLEFDAVNKSIQEITNPEYKWGRKVFADFYVDDSAVVFDDSHMNFLSLRDRAIVLA